MKKWKMTALVALGICVSLSLTGCKSAMEKGMESLQGKKYETAIEEFQKSIDDEKNIAECYRGIGMAYWEQEDYKNAQKAFSSAIENGAKKTGTIYNFLGVCAMKQEDYKTALNFMRLGQECEGNAEELSKEMAFNEIVCYEKLEQWSSAKSSMAEYVEKYPDDEAAARENEFLKSR